LEEALELFWFLMIGVDPTGETGQGLSVLGFVYLLNIECVGKLRNRKVC